MATRSPILAENLKKQLETAHAKDIVITDTYESTIAALNDTPEAALLCDYYFAEESGEALATKTDQTGSRVCCHSN